jgi:hypothetical protein
VEGLFVIFETEVVFLQDGGRNLGLTGMWLLTGELDSIQAIDHRVDGCGRR